MKNISLSAEERLIEQAQELARARKTSLNQMFREWLTGLSKDRERGRKIDALFERCDGVNSGGKFRREEMNAR